MNKLTFDQLNLVCGDPDASIAFYRRLGVEIAESQIWRTRTGAHHISAVRPASAEAPALDLDSVPFAELWNQGWRGQPGLAGRVVVGFGAATREEVDVVFSDMVGAGYRALQAPHDAFWGARYAVIEDPDGIAVGVMSPVSPAMKTPPPEI